MPKVLTENVDHIRSMNPDWEHRLYDGRAIDEFVLEHYGTDVADLLHRINPLYGAARADLFRYLLMYKCGGVYLDIKSTTNKSLNLSIREDDQFILSHWRNGPGEPHAGWGLQREFGNDLKREFQQWHIISAPGHPFLKAVIERVLSNIQSYRSWVFGVGNRGVWKTTGPIPYTLAIEPLMSGNPYRLIADETAMFLQFNIFKDSGHSNLFGTYYGLLSEPVVQMDGWMSPPLHRVYAQARRWYRTAREWRRLGVVPMRG
ncbi:glycosyltransferase family 32 protein [Rhodopseudomonas sp. NSM]|uniref:glycosyltransferase family 32 protein n=1 Tax=Rhodopseudomonas sp. NSM TaxID=3457630 RepID=UPI0040359D5D